MAKYVRRHLMDPGDRLISADDVDPAFYRQRNANYFCPNENCPCVYRYRAAAGKRAAHFYQYGPVHAEGCPYGKRQEDAEEEIG